MRLFRSEPDAFSFVGERSRQRFFWIKTDVAYSSYRVTCLTMEVTASSSVD
jgi:hypothetical protein